MASISHMHLVPLGRKTFWSLLSCIASVSVRFGSKQRGTRQTRVKDRTKNGASKRAGRGGFLPSLPPLPLSRAAKTENPLLRSFFAPKPHGHACYAGYKVVCTGWRLTRWNISPVWYSSIDSLIIGDGSESPTFQPNLSIVLSFTSVLFLPLSLHCLHEFTVNFKRERNSLPKKTEIPPHQWASEGMGYRYAFLNNDSVVSWPL